MSNFFANAIAIVECFGAFWLGYLFFNFLRNHPKYAHLDEEHLFMWSAAPVGLMLLVIASHWMFALVFIGAGWFAMTIMALQAALFLVGLMKIIHYGFKFFGNKTP